MKSHTLQMCPTLRQLVLTGACSSLALLSACTPKQQTIVCDVPDIDAKQVKLEQSNTIDLSIYVDGTVSMVGYVQPGSSQYKKFLDALNSVASSRWSKQPPKYFRFGNSKNAIDRSVYRQASLSSFYQSGPGYQSSQIEKLISPPTEAGVSLIITDLYQKDADVQLVQRQLTQHYLNKGYAIGILGIKSQFQGKIYDVGPGNQTFSYSTQGKQSNNFHPFYVLILGSHGNVNQFYNRLRENGLEDHQFSVFFPHPVSQVATVEDAADLDIPRELKIVKALNDGKSLVKVEDREPVQLLMANRKKETPILFQPSLNLSTLANVIPVAGESIQVKSSVSQYKNNSNGFEAIKTQAVRMSDITVSAQSLSFTSEIDTDGLKKGLYQVSFDLLARDFQEPDWWSNWSAGSSSTNGAKTNNLKPFLQVLRRNTSDIMSQNETPIAKICYGIQRR